MRAALTTVKFATDTQIAETTIPGSSGVLVHTYGVEVDHDFRRWLTAVGKFTYGTYDYQGQNRNDKTYSLESNLIYKLNRNIWIKGTLRHDILDSNQPGLKLAGDGGGGRGEAAELARVDVAIGEAKPEVSSWRKPGPITTGVVW